MHGRHTLTTRLAMRRCGAATTAAAVVAQGYGGDAWSTYTNNQASSAEVWGSSGMPTHAARGHGNPRVAADTPTPAAARTAVAPHRHTSLRDVAVGTGTRSDTVRRDHQSHTTQSLATLTQPTAQVPRQRAPRKQTQTQGKCMKQQRHDRAVTGGSGSTAAPSAPATQRTHSPSRPAAACTRSTTTHASTEIAT
jgi:hypothetical protein